MGNGGNPSGFPPLPCASMGEGGQSIMRQDVFRLGGNIMLRLKSLIAFIAFDFVKSHRDQWPGEGSFLKLFIWSKEPSSAPRSPWLLTKPSKAIKAIVGLNSEHNVTAKTMASWRIMLWAPSPTLRAGEGESDQGPVQLQSPPLFSLGLIPQ